MVKLMNSELLNDVQVKKEIERHKWFESEKAGFDIGFDKAAEDWLDRYSEQWLKQHPRQSIKSTGTAKRLFKSKAL